MICAFKLSCDGHVNGFALLGENSMRAASCGNDNGCAIYVNSCMCVSDQTYCDIKPVVAVEVLSLGSYAKISYRQ